MADKFINAFKNIFQLNNLEISTIIDNKNELWFSAKEVTSILGYKKSHDAIQTYVNINDRKYLSELSKFIKINNIQSDMQPNSLYINLPGLYNLILNSTIPEAKKFRKWVTAEILPSILNKGSYTFKSDVQLEIEKLRAKMEFYKKEIQILKRNEVSELNTGASNNVKIDFDKDQVGGDNNSDNINHDQPPMIIWNILTPTCQIL